MPSGIVKRLNPTKGYGSIQLVQFCQIGTDPARVSTSFQSIV